MNFRSHICLGSFFGSVCLWVWSKSEVRNFQWKFITHQNVFRFEVSVRNSFVVHVIKCFDNLVKEISCHIFRELSCLRNVFKQFSALSKFKSNIKYISSSSTCSLFDRWSIVLFEFNDVFMFELRMNLTFVVDQIDKCLCYILSLHDFKCYLFFSILMNC